MPRAQASIVCSLTLLFGLDANGVFKAPAGTKAVATIALAGKPATNVRFEIK